MRSILVAVLLCFLPGAIHAGQKTELPRTLSNAIYLGMTKELFVKKFDIEPIRCASCYHGELLAQPTIEDTPDVISALSSLGLSFGPPPHQVDLFFKHGVLTTIHLEGLGATNTLDVLERKFGKGHTVHRSSDIVEIEWSDTRTRLRLTKWESEFQLTLSNRKIKGATH